MNRPIADRLKRLNRRDWNVYRDRVARFEAASSGSSGAPTIDDFLASPEQQPLRSLLLIHLIKEEYERKRGHGEIVAMADYFERFPELSADPIAMEELRSWEGKLTGLIEKDAEALSPPSLPPGYRFIRELPRGGMSRLFLVANGTGGLEVLKQIDPARRGNDDDVKRFENEISLARALAAKGIGVVAVFFAGQVDGLLFCTVPYCAGGSLRDRMRAREGKPLVARDAARLIAALARTVQKL
jgi:Phosphotransferase enzyme family